MNKSWSMFRNDGIHMECIQRLGREQGIWKRSWQAWTDMWFLSIWLPYVGWRYDLFYFYFYCPLVSHHLFLCKQRWSITKKMTRILDMVCILSQVWFCIMQKKRTSTSACWHLLYMMEFLSSSSTFLFSSPHPLPCQHSSVFALNGICKLSK